MLTSVRWLKEYVDIPWNAKELADRMTMTGTKVESIGTRSGGISGVVVGRIIEAVPHPDAEGLWICRVDIGSRTVQSVCGAPNAAAGILVPVALQGAQLPGLDGPVGTATVKGVESEAVLCSEAEIGVSDDHSGLMILSGELETGADIARALGLDDIVIEFEISPNRPDCLSVVGLAREIAAISEGTLRFPDLETPEADTTVESLAQVRVEAPDRCPRYMARVIRNVRIGPSPQWMQSHLRAAGMRPINNVVDVTNFVMLELGQPLHAFDLARLAGSKIVVRLAADGERITTLDGVERSLTDDDLLICDAERPVAVAGVMGGLDSEVTEATTDILLESASFEPTGVRRTARRLGLRTEASHRFEKGIDPHLAELAIDRAAHLLVKVAGGEAAAGRIDVRKALPGPRTIHARPKFVNRLLGANISPAEMKRILKGLEFGAELEKGAESIAVTVPTFRRDVEGEADIAEEVARIYGFDRIEATLPSGASGQGKLSAPLPLVEQIREVLVAAGFLESITYSFISPKGFDRLGLPEDHPWRRAIPLANPLSDEQSVMRTTLLHSTLSAVGLNVRRRREDVRLFEVGKVYITENLPLTALPDERWTLSVALSGAPASAVWGAPRRSVDFFDLKGAVELVLDKLGKSVEWVRAEAPHLHPGRSATILFDGRPLGHAGEVHPKVAEAYELRERAYVCELDLEPLLATPAAPTQYRSLPKHPVVLRDLALLVPKHVAASGVETVIKANGGELLRDVALFDVYEGKQIPENMRSLAYKITFQADQRTLTDEEVASAMGRLQAQLKSELGVDIRG